MKTVHSLVKVAAALGLVAGLGACGTPDDSSDLNITNGKNALAHEYPSVVTLYDAKAGGLCSGTFINETTVLTAAHCTMSYKIDSQGNVNGKLAIINIVDSSKGEASLIAESTSAVRNPLWDKSGGQVSPYDLALITFPAGVSKAVSELATSRVKPGDPLTIVGFGLNQTTNMSDASSVGVKRIGLNTISSVSGGFIQFKGANKTTKTDGSAKDSSASVGDSGGPLFVNGKLAGVTSGGGGGLGSIFTGKTTNLYVDLQSAESKAFLAKNLKD